MSNTPKRRADAFAKPQKVKSTTAPTPAPRKLKVSARDPYKGGKSSQAPFLREDLARGGGSPKGP